MELTSIFLVLGGLSLLLFSMKMMSSGLEMAAGDSLQTVLRRSTSNRVFAVLAGIIATIALTSSTAVTIIVVSFVNSKLLTLTQSIGVIMGANVGTTFSAQLIAFKITDYAPLFICIGTIMYLFFKTKTLKNVGYIVLGFGILFFSIGVMGGPLRELANDPEVYSLLTTFDNPLLALLVGFGFTAIIQSSSATMGLLITLHLSGVPLSFETSAFIVLGTNIGTSITTVLASIPASRDSKRAALFHIMYDIIGCLVFGTLIYVFPGILEWFTETWSEKARQVAMFHTLYNVATMLLLLSFVPLISKMMQKIVPMKQSETQNTYEKKLMYLDEKNIYSPTLSVTNAHLEICRMGIIAKENLSLALDSFFEKDLDKAKKVVENEKIINFLYRGISEKLVEINNIALSEADAEKVGKMFKTLSDIERIGDHAENIAEYANIYKDGKLNFSKPAMQELKSLSKLTIEMIELSIDVYKNDKIAELSEIEKMEDEIDARAVEYTENHVERLKAQVCSPKTGVLFTDIIIDLERSADHANNVAFYTLPSRKVVNPKSTITQIKQILPSALQISDKENSEKNQ